MTWKSATSYSWLASNHKPCVPNREHNSALWTAFKRAVLSIASIINSFRAFAVVHIAVVPIFLLHSTCKFGLSIRWVAIGPSVNKDVLRCLPCVIPFLSCNCLSIVWTDSRSTLAMNGAGRHTPFGNAALPFVPFPLPQIRVTITGANNRIQRWTY